jgi:hypothetical protein
MVVADTPIHGKEAPRMCHSSQERLRQQVQFLRRQFLQDGDLPFTNILTEEVIAQALTAVTGWLDRIFSPLVTLRVFLGQVLGADHSCRAAVARLIVHRLAQGQRPCSAETGAYCQARQRLPESFFKDVACQTGRALETDVDSRWLWKGRHVYLFDGTTVTMPDTRENQKAYPQVYNQKPGLGFPIARLGALISVACGAVVNLDICQYAGKGQGEVSLLRTLWDTLRPGGPCCHQWSPTRGSAGTFTAESAKSTEEERAKNKTQGGRTPCRPPASSCSFISSLSPRSLRSLRRAIRANFLVRQRQKLSGFLCAKTQLGANLE